MSAPAAIREPSWITKRQIYALGAASALTIGAFIVWPSLAARLLATDFLPHVYCYLGNPGLVWTQVVADSLIAVAYLAISITLA